MFARAARLGLITLAAASALAAAGGPSAAQDNSKSAATPPASSDGGDAARIAEGKEIFADYGCGACHTLADAGAAGGVGPALDGDTNLSQDLIIDRVTNGQGQMPAFGDQLSQDQKAALAAYVLAAAAK